MGTTPTQPTGENFRRFVASDEDAISLERAVRSGAKWVAKLDEGGQSGVDRHDTLSALRGSSLEVARLSGAELVVDAMGDPSETACREVITRLAVELPVPEAEPKPEPELTLDL